MGSDVDPKKLLGWNPKTNSYIMQFSKDADGNKKFNLNLEGLFSDAFREKIGNNSWLSGLTSGGSGSSSNASSNVSSNTSSNTSTGGTTSAPREDVKRFKSWKDTVNFYFPDSMKAGGLVRGGGKAQRGVGRGRMR